MAATPPRCPSAPATIAGVRHRLAGRAGEDAFAWATTPDGIVVAVADGVSATPGAATSATVAADAACMLPPDESLTPVERCRAAIAAANGATAAASAAGPPAATTLVVGVVAAAGDWALARVGDSTAFVLGAGRWGEAFFHPGDRDEPLSTATAALPASDPSIECAHGRLGPDDVLILVTDGVAAPLPRWPGHGGTGVRRYLTFPTVSVDLGRADRLFPPGVPRRSHGARGVGPPRATVALTKFPCMSRLRHRRQGGLHRKRAARRAAGGGRQVGGDLGARLLRGNGPHRRPHHRVVAGPRRSWLPERSTCRRRTGAADRGSASSPWSARRSRPRVAHCC